ncbi:MAG: hypothetical protein FWH27_01345 [Planctomycetaceae bacterium]|nr:hypothetical protein [Planctomycetaceae bacterium]
MNSKGAVGTKTRSAFFIVPCREKCAKKLYWHTDKHVLTASAASKTASLPSCILRHVLEYDFQYGRYYQSTLGGYANTSNAADWLVKKGVLFRESHKIIGRLVFYALSKKTRLDELK